MLFSSYFLYQYAQGQTRETVQRSLTLFTYLREMLKQPTLSVNDDYHDNKLILINKMQRINPNISFSDQPKYNDQIELTNEPQLPLSHMQNRVLGDSYSIYLPNMAQWLNIKSNRSAYFFILIIIILQLLLLCFLIYYAYSSIKLLRPWLRLNELSNQLMIGGTGDVSMVTSGPKLIRLSSGMMAKMIEKLKQSNDERNITLKALTHDLRTPLAKLQLLAERVENEKLEQSISHEVGALNDYLTHILNYMQRSFSLEKVTDINLDNLLSQLVDEYKNVHAKVTLIKMPSYSSQMIKGQPKLLASAFKNIINNALKYAGDCDIAIRSNKSQTIVEFIDHGDQLSDETLRLMATPFFRADPARTAKVKGSGLGLSITKAILFNHNAKVQFTRANKDIGLCVRVVFQ
ncbi:MULTISPECIES: sensor histidine kinase [Cysteiniphilum]|nr:MULTISPECIES: HAMP domain-containing sensor histidine kinase [Cysteiniphilum]